MANPVEKFRAELDQVRKGSPQAVQEFVERWSHPVISAIRRRLNLTPGLRSMYDSDDFSQMLWARFFIDELQRRRFETSEELATFLFNLAADIVRGAVREHLTAQKRDLRREQSLDSPRSPGEALTSHEPGPDQLALAEDEWHFLLRTLPPQHRRMLELLREGHTCAAIAEKLGFNERTVRRVLERARQRMRPPPEPEP